MLNADYNGEPQNLVSVSAATEDVTIEYSRDGNTWVATCPSETNAGEYPVYVKITKMDTVHIYRRTNCENK